MANDSCHKKGKHSFVMRTHSPARKTNSSVCVTSIGHSKPPYLVHISIHPDRNIYLANFEWQFHPDTSYAAVGRGSELDIHHIGRRNMIPSSRIYHRDSSTFKAHLMADAFLFLFLKPMRGWKGEANGVDFKRWERRGALSEGKSDGKRAMRCGRWEMGLTFFFTRNSKSV